ncbi:AsmA family protein [Cypionkella sp.]|uniref:AsmA family protein n=1 Tax=Cypionkella sp. TaxID=2811411 RepID=UPI00271E6232|nr:AsmA family protein [Cypionkella sp.]MDO8985772.1 AsmA family protein [Cypionkella sp.]MDP2051352.1 AsmA family protein [Cypionkella sp.]
MRWIIRSVIAVVLLAIVLVGSVFLIPAEKVAGIAVAKFNALTGRELVISGAVRPSIWPQLGVTTGPISISNAAWSKEGPMVQAEGLSISLDLAALIGGDVKITGVEAINPKIVLERSAKGAENWVFGGEAGGTVSAATPGVGQPFTLDKASVSGGALVFADHAAGVRYEVSGIEAAAAIPRYTGPATIDMAAVMNGQSFTLTGKVGAFQDFLDGKLVDSDLKLIAGAAEVGFKGTAGLGPEAKGALSADLGDLAAISALAGIAAPKLPEGLGASDVQVVGAVTLTTAGSLHLRAGAVVLDGNKLAMDADLVTAGERAKLSAKVTAAALDLAGVSGGQGGGESGGVQAAGWPTDKIDVSGLSGLDAVVALTADSIDLGMVKFGASQIVLTNDRSRLVAELRKVSAYEGVISGQFVVNGRKGLSVGGDLSFAGMALRPMLADFGGYERLVGTGDMRVKFLGSGASVDAIMQSLSGSGSLALSNGEILGLDIAGMLRTLDTSYVGEGQKTIFDSLGGSFTMADGVLRNEDLVLKSPYITARGVGDVGMGARTLEYRIKATALADDTGAGGLTAPLLIKGSWANPKFSLDLQAIADEKLAEQTAALEAQAEAKRAELEAEARAKLESELGVVQQDGESLEDAAKRRMNEAVDEQAQKALQKLLGGGN